MLPEKKKNLIISLISLVVLIVGIFLIIGISNLVKENNRKYEKSNDEYLNLYNYFGIAKDQDDVYKLYGINDQEEIFLNVHSFYDVVDAKVINDHIVFYSDGVNELRYDNAKNEFYLYEIDSFYNKSSEKYLAKDFLVVNDQETIKFSKYGNNLEDAKVIEEKIKNILILDNILYYQKEDGIYEYNLDNKEEIKLFSTSNANLWKVNNKFLYFYEDNNLYYWDFQSKEKIKLEITDLTNVLDIWEDGIIFKSFNQVNKYFLDKRVEKLNTDLLVVDLKYLENDTYYMKLDDKSILYDNQNNKTIKELANDYLYIWKGKVK